MCTHLQLKCGANHKSKHSNVTKVWPFWLMVGCDWLVMLLQLSAVHQKMWLYFLAATTSIIKRIWIVKTSIYSYGKESSFITRHVISQLQLFIIVFFVLSSCIIGCRHSHCGVISSHIDSKCYFTHTVCHVNSSGLIVVFLRPCGVWQNITTQWTAAQTLILWLSEVSGVTEIRSDQRFLRTLKRFNSFQIGL